MDTRPFPVNKGAMVVAVVIGLTMTTSIMTKQAFAFEDPRHCNIGDVLQIQHRI